MSLSDGFEDSLIGRRVADRFVIESRIGHGGMGVVYRAMQASVGRAIALKILPAVIGGDRERSERFEREARITAGLRSPHTVTVFDFGRLDDGSLFIAMELLLGRSLSAIIRREAPLPIARAVSILDQVAASLEEAHARGLIHRDLKPANIIVEDRGGGVEHAKVLDFGIAKIIGAEGPGVTKSGTIIGTPQYISPEQCQGDASLVGPAADLYALGVVAFEMLSGRLPFESDNVVALLLAHVREAPPRLTQFLADKPAVQRLDAIVSRLLEKDPTKRFASATELRAELRALGPIDAHAASSDVLPTVAVSQPPGSKQTIVLAILFVLLIAAGASLRAFFDRVEDAPVVEETAAPQTTTATVAQIPTQPKPAQPAHPPKRTRIASIEVGPNLDRAGAENAIRAAARALERCADRPNAAGKTIFLTLTAASTIVSVRPEDEALAACARPILLSAKLPKPSAQFSTISIRLR